MEDLERLVRVERGEDLRDRAEVPVDELAEAARVVSAPVPERPPTKSSKPGVQNVFWTSTTTSAIRKRSVAAAASACSFRQRAASSKRAA